MQKLSDIFYFHEGKTLIKQGCIKSCINDNFYKFLKPYISRGSQIINFLKLLLCKPKMNVLFMSIQRESYD